MLEQNHVTGTPWDWQQETYANRYRLPCSVQPLHDCHIATLPACDTATKLTALLAGQMECLPISKPEILLARPVDNLVPLAAMIFATANSKGGVGKTTVSVHLAGWFHLHGMKVVLVDCDPQQQAAGWLSEAVPEIDIECHTDPTKIIEELPKLLKSHHVVVADGSAKLDEVSRALLLVSDAVFVPCKAGGLEARALTLATNVIRQVKEIRKGPPLAVTLLTQVQERYVLTGDMAEAAEEIGFPVLDQKLSLSQVYAQAPTDGKLLWQMGSRAKKHALEIDAVFRQTLPAVLDDSGMSEVQKLYQRKSKRTRKHAA